ncbi:MAG: RibD family protein [Gemmatimonadetes bacterium]|nr:RibD family protein [Gemmatimonadota bacterium]
MNENETKYRSTGLPYVTLKLAQTLDGNIATCTGDSKWITSKASRVRGHQLRAEADAILVGRGTVMADDPELSVRHVDGCSPTKIVLDSRLKIGLNAKIFSGTPPIIATTEEVCKKRIKERKKKGAQIWQLPVMNSQIDLKAVLQKAALSGLRHILIEGGSRVAASALRLGLVDRIAAFVAPKILGAGIPSIGSLNITSITDAIELENVKVESIGNDFLFTARVKKTSKNG